jgi:oligopeptide transport system substrate-binding protein
MMAAAPPVRRLLAACGLVAALAAHAQAPSVLTVPRADEFETMDPPGAFDEKSEQVQRQVYGTLLTYAYLERPYKLVPDLAAAMPALSADKLTYTFRLRPGVRFHDNPCFAGGKGRELTSDDVLYSLKRYADANLNRHSWFAMAGAVAGLDAYHAATLKAGPAADLTATPVAGLRRIDGLAFSITLTRPNPLFLFALALTSTAVVPVEAVRMHKDRFGVNPVGTGPFMIKGPVDRKATLHFVRNPGYYGTYPSTGAPGDAEAGLLKDAGRRLPLVDALDMPLVQEPQTAALKFLHGDLDLRPLDRANFVKMVARGPDGTFRLSGDYAGKFALYGASALDTYYMRLNMKDALIGGNVKLRRALAAAVDAQAIIDVLNNGQGRRLQSLVPFDLPGSERDTGAVGIAHDVEAAKRLLAEAGYPGGKGLAPLSISFVGADSATHNLADLLRAQFARVGIVVWPEFMDLPAHTKAMESGNFQVSYNFWYADYPDPEDFYQLFYSRNTAPGPNIGAYANPAYDKAYETMRLMPNGPERVAQAKAMNAILKDDVPVIVLYDSMRYGLAQKWVGGFKRNVFLQEHMFMSVDMAAKKKGP